MSEELRVVLCTCPAKDGGRIAHALVGERLVACVNVVAGVTSIYRWNEAVQEDAEVLLVMKTRSSLFEPLEARIRELHPYEVPEIVALPVFAVSAPYLKWVLDATRHTI
jgi:periplasmic divalent cation tolerance protein